MKSSQRGTILNRLSLIFFVILPLSFAVSCKKLNITDPSSSSSSVNKRKPNKSEDLTPGKPIVSESETSIIPDQLSQEFTSSTVNEAFFQVEPGRAMIQEDITLVRGDVRGKHEDRYTQLVMEQVSETFTQGHSQKTVEESFEGSKKGIVDLLVVVDNSSSMAEEQQLLTGAFSDLTSAISASSWRIAIITTDESQTCVRGLIFKNDQNAAQLFSDAISAGTQGDGKEAGILAAVNGLQCLPRWSRYDSSLAVLIVSDEDNCSDGGDCSGEAWASENYLLNYLKTSRTLAVDTRVYGLIYKPGVICPTALQPGYTYAKAVAATEGISESICQPSYADSLRKISNNIKSLIKNQYSLSYKPALDTLTLSINDQLQSDNFSLVETTLNINKAIADSDTIKVNYRVDAVPVTSTFKLKEKPIEGSVKVRVNGKTISYNSFEVDYDLGEIKFQKAPEENSEIRVIYKKEVPLTESYTLKEHTVFDTITASVGSEVYTIKDYDEQSRQVTFNKTVPEGETIVISYDTLKRGVEMLEYQLAYKDPEKAPLNLKGFDPKNQTEVQVSYSEGKLVIPETEFVDDRQVLISYTNPWSAKNEYPLAFQPIAGTISVVATEDDGSQTECKDNEIIFQNDKLSLNCRLPTDSFISVNYKYETDPQTSFELTNIPYPDIARWLVTVNGQPTNLFTREGTTITFQLPLPPGAQVKVEVIYNNF